VVKRGGVWGCPKAGGEEGAEELKWGEGRKGRGKRGVWSLEGYIEIYNLQGIKGKVFALKTNFSSFYKAVERVL